MADKDIEYQQTITYLQHMYETRHRIFNFTIALNVGLLAVLFNLTNSPLARSLFSLVAFTILLFLTLMSRRSDIYRAQVERYAEELESSLGFGLVSSTNARMPKGTGSTQYLFYCYWMMVLVWCFAFAYCAAGWFGFDVPTF